VRPFAWSFSALDNWETCPKKYWEISIAKRVLDSTTEVGDWGKDAHKAIELRILKKKPFPLGMRHFEPFVSRFIDAPGDTYAEQKIAITREYRPTEYFGKDVWLRSQMDAGKHRGSKLAIVDWKFGKVTEKWPTQGLIMAATVFAQMPEVQDLTISFIWWKEMENGIPLISIDRMSRDEFWVRWLPIVRRAQKMEMAWEEESFPAKPNGLCKRFCPVKTCPHNGRG